VTVLGCGARTYILLGGGAFWGWPSEVC